MRRVTSYLPESSTSHLLDDGSYRDNKPFGSEPFGAPLGKVFTVLGAPAPTDISSFMVNDFNPVSASIGVTPILPITSDGIYILCCTKGTEISLTSTTGSLIGIGVDTATSGDTTTVIAEDVLLHIEARLDGADVKLERGTVLYITKVGATATLPHTMVSATCGMFEDRDNLDVDDLPRKSWTKAWRVAYKELPPKDGIIPPNILILDNEVDGVTEIPLTGTGEVLIAAARKTTTTVDKSTMYATPASLYASPELTTTPTTIVEYGALYNYLFYEKSTAYGDVYRINYHFNLGYPLSGVSHGGVVVANGIEKTVKFPSPLSYTTHVKEVYRGVHPDYSYITLATFAKYTVRDYGGSKPEVSVEVLEYSGMDDYFVYRPLPTANDIEVGNTTGLIDAGYYNNENDYRQTNSAFWRTGYVRFGTLLRIRPRLDRAYWSNGITCADGSVDDAYAAEKLIGAASDSSKTGLYMIGDAPPTRGGSGGYSVIGIAVNINDANINDNLYATGMPAGYANGTWSYYLTTVVFTKAFRYTYKLSPVPVIPEEDMLEALSNCESYVEDVYYRDIRLASIIPELSAAIPIPLTSRGVGGGVNDYYDLVSSLPPVGATISDTLHPSLVPLENAPVSESGNSFICVERIYPEVYVLDWWSARGVTQMRLRLARRVAVGNLTYAVTEVTEDVTKNTLTAKTGGISIYPTQIHDTIAAPFEDKTGVGDIPHPDFTVAATPETPAPQESITVDITPDVL